MIYFWLSYCGSPIAQNARSDRIFSILPPSSVFSPFPGASWPFHFVWLCHSTSPIQFLNSLTSKVPSLCYFTSTRYFFPLHPQKLCPCLLFLLCHCHRALEEWGYPISSLFIGVHGLQKYALNYEKLGVGIVDQTDIFETWPLSSIGLIVRLWSFRSTPDRKVGRSIRSVVKLLLLNFHRFLSIFRSIYYLR